MKEISPILSLQNTYEYITKNTPTMIQIRWPYQCKLNKILYINNNVFNLKVSKRRKDGID